MQTRRTFLRNLVVGLVAAPMLCRATTTTTLKLEKPIWASKDYLAQLGWTWWQGYLMRPSFRPNTIVREGPFQSVKDQWGVEWVKLPHDTGCVPEGGFWKRYAKIS